MTNNLFAMTAIALMASILLVTRVAGTELMTKVRITPKIEAFLEAMSGSVIVAIVVNEIAAGGLRTFLAIAVTGIVLQRSQSAVLAMVAGIACAALWVFVSG